MTKILLSVIFTLMASAAFGTAPGNLFTVAPRGAKPQSTAAEQPGELNYRQNAYGLPDALRGTGVAFDVGYVSFPLQTPRTRTTVHAFSNPLIIAGTMMPDGKMLAFTFVETSSSIKMEKMVRMDPATGAFTDVAALPDGYPNILDLTYEPVSAKLLGLAAWPADKTPSLVSINPTTAEITLLRKLDNVWYSLAADGSGRVFFVRQSNGDVGVSFNPLDGTEPVIAAKGSASAASYVSSMAMDRDDYMLYWASCASNGRSTLFKINPATGATTNLGTIGTAAVSTEVMALNIAASEPAAGTPQAPSSLLVKAAASGSLTATATWTNPAADSLCLFLNGELLKTFVGVQSGSNGNMELSGLRQGYNHLRLTTANAAGKGRYADAFFWAGHDVPRAVSNLKVQRVASDSALLTWTAPSSTVHGGYVSLTGIKYRITRYSLAGDTTVVSKTYRGTSFREKISTPGNYYYTVQSLSSDYGETATSEALYLGPALSLPYNCDFSTRAAYTLWTPKSMNGNSRCWTYYSYKPQHVYNPPFNKGNNDWFLSAPFSLEQGKEYYIYMQIKSGLGEYYPKMFDISLGKDDSVDGRTTIYRDTIASKAIEEVRITAKVDKTGEYTLALHDYSPFISCNLYLYKVSVCEKTTGKISGRITDNTGKGVSGVTVSLDQTTLTATSGADGHYLIDYIEPGTYSLSAFKPGYASHSSSAPLNVESKSTLQYDFKLNPTARATVKGIVKDDNNMPLQGVKVEFTAEGLSYSATTGADGSYTISDVSAGSYSYTASRLRFLTLRGNATVTAETDLPMTLKALDLPPHGLKSTSADDGSVKLTWNEPRDLFRRDNGVPKSQNGAMVGTDNYLFGCVWKQPATLNAISWMTTEYQGPHNYMNLWVLDVKADGTPSAKVLYNAMNVPANGDLVWNRHEMDAPVNCPNGFYLAVSYRGMASIAMSDGEDADWPFVAGVNYRSSDFRTDNWTCVDASFVKNNYMLRAEGTGLGIAPVSYAYRYNVWRLPADAQTDTVKWVALTPAGGIADTSFADAHTDVADGDYRYAVAACYPDGRISSVLFSEPVHLTNGVAQLGIDGLLIPSGPVADVLPLGVRVDEAAVYALDGSVKLRSSDTDLLDMSGMVAGCYILRVKLAQRVSVIKIIKK